MSSQNVQAVVRYRVRPLDLQETSSENSMLVWREVVSTTDYDALLAECARLRGEVERLKDAHTTAREEVEQWHGTAISYSAQLSQLQATSDLHRASLNEVCAERDRLQATSDAREAALRAFADHYPCGVSPELDAAYGAARRALAKPLEREPPAC